MQLIGRKARPWWADIFIQAAGNIVAGITITIYLALVGIIKKSTFDLVLPVIVFGIPALLCLAGISFGRAIRGTQVHRVSHALTIVSTLAFLWLTPQWGNPEEPDWLFEAWGFSLFASGLTVGISIGLLSESEQMRTFLSRINWPWRSTKSKPDPQ
jgi:hypothetical protein